jgi:hypothetical protein
VDKRPQLADLRELGDLENPADSVLGLYREEMDHPGDDVKNKKIAELSVLKTRQLGKKVGTNPSTGVGGRELPGSRSRPAPARCPRTTAVSRS